MQRILEGNIYLQFLLLINFSKMTLKERILRHKRGKIFFIDYFPDYKDEYVKKILFELENEGILIRLAPGMYYLPIQSRLGVLYPSVEEIVQAIAKRDHATIMPSANTALHQLGFTPQVPMNYEYLTNGAARIVHLEHNTVRLKHGVASNFAYRGKLMPLLHQALQAIGKVNITDTDKAHAAHLLLANPEPRTWKHDVRLMPAWERAIVEPIIKNYHEQVD